MARASGSGIGASFLLTLGALFLFSTAAAAEPDTAVSAVVEDAAPERRHLVYGELLGKLGLYSLGYEYQLTDWLSVGGAGSFWLASYRRVMAGTLYLGVGTAIRGKHRWFAQVGPEIIRESEPAVPGFGGLARTGIGAQLSAGYEYRGERWLFRGHGTVTAGKGGVAPWLGAAVGVRF